MSVKAANRIQQRQFATPSVRDSGEEVDCHDDEVVLKSSTDDGPRLTADFPKLQPSFPLGMDE